MKTVGLIGDAVMISNFVRKARESSPLRPLIPLLLQHKSLTEGLPNYKGISMTNSVPSSRTELQLKRPLWVCSTI